MRPIATTLRIKEISKRSGKRKNLNFAILDSIMAMIKQNINIFTKIIINPRRRAFNPRPDAIPHGKNKFAPKIAKIISLLPEAHSSKANFLPEYYKIMAS